MHESVRRLVLVVLMAVLVACGTPTPTTSPATDTANTTITATSPADATAAPMPTLEETATASAGATAIAPTNETAAAAGTTASAASSTADVILATTTSTQDSGLLDVLIPRFEEQSGYAVKTIAVGSGAAIALGERGEADVVLAHAPENERQLVASGAGIDRSLVMYNDFILVGPASDPAGLKGSTEIVRAMQQIASSGSSFVSRGDNSGTHQLELKVWQSAAITPQGQPWYIESGTGMGQTLQIADQREGYTLSDRATYLAWRDRVALTPVVEGDTALLNVYHVIAVNPEKFGGVNAAGAQAFIRFLLSDEAQTLIGEFGRDRYDQALFTPCARNSCGLAGDGD